jgi:hypothetical protein
MRLAIENCDAPSARAKEPSLFGARGPGGTCDRDWLDDRLNELGPFLCGVMELDISILQDLDHHQPHFPITSPDVHYVQLVGT